MINSRRKGVNGELEACKLWRPYFPDVRRSFGQARQGYEQPDLIGGMIERSFFIEVKRTNRPPTKGEIEKWKAKQQGDYIKYRCRGGEETEYMFIMWRANNRAWQVLFHNMCDGCDRYTVCSWEDFEVKLQARFFPAVHSPTKRKTEVKDE